MNQDRVTKFLKSYFANLYLCYLYTSSLPISILSYFLRSRRFFLSTIPPVFPFLLSHTYTISLRFQFILHSPLSIFSILSLRLTPLIDLLYSISLGSSQASSPDGHYTIRRGPPLFSPSFYNPQIIVFHFRNTSDRFLYFSSTLVTFQSDFRRLFHRRHLVTKLSLAVFYKTESFI